VVYSVDGWDLAGTLFEDGVLGQKGTGFRARLDSVESEGDVGVSIMGYDRGTSKFGD